MDIKRKRRPITKSKFKSSTDIVLTEKERKSRKPWKWTPMKKARRADVLAVFKELEDYLPITVRQAYYRLISTGATSQDHWHKNGNPSKPLCNIADALGPILKWMRIDGFLPWDAITDETRVLTEPYSSANPKEFIFKVLNYLNRYRRCVASDQPYHIEIWIEKMALLRIVEPVADKYCRRVLCCRGYNSITFQTEFYIRMEDAKKVDLQPVVLYFGDWDPSGWDMFIAAIKTLEVELGLTGVIWKRCGINPEHFAGLQSGEPVPLNPKDKKAKTFRQIHGPTCYELDAFHPEELKKLVEEWIETYTDLEKVSCNLERQEDDIDLIDNVREKLISYAEALIEM